MASNASEGEGSVRFTASKKERFRALRGTYETTTGPHEPAGLTRATAPAYAEKLQEYVWYRTKQITSSTMCDSILYGFFAESFKGWILQKFEWAGATSLEPLWHALRVGGCQVPAPQRPAALVADVWVEWSIEEWASSDYADAQTRSMRLEKKLRITAGAEPRRQEAYTTTPQFALPAFNKGTPA